MPRIKQNAKKYDESDFRKEMFMRMAFRYDEVSVRRLAEEADISQSTLNAYLRHSADSLNVRMFRRIIPILKPDPAVVLKFLGYDGKDISKFKNQKEEAL